MSNNSVIENLKELFIEYYISSSKFEYLFGSDVTLRKAILNLFCTNFIQVCSTVDAIVTLQNANHSLMAFVVVFDTERWPSWWELYRKSICIKERFIIKDEEEKGRIDGRMVKVCYEIQSIEESFICKYPRALYIEDIGILMSYEACSSSERNELMKIVFDRVKSDAKQKAISLFIHVEREEIRTWLHQCECVNECVSYQVQGINMALFLIDP